MPIQLPQDLVNHVRHALKEDVGSGDLTATLVPVDATCKANLLVREPAVLCGVAWFDETFRQLDKRINVSWQAADGDEVNIDQVLCTVDGPSRGILTGERTALNFLQTLSGTATVTRQYAKAIQNTDCRVLDTRKTLPGLRTAQKYATACGGADNHRMGLYDAVLIKENHIRAAGSIAAAIKQVQRDLPANIRIEIEVESIVELKQALAAGAEFLLLDNFSLEELSQAATLAGTTAKLEASGNIELDRLRDVAETGVHFISIGALTKHVRAIDLSLLFQ
ncbi:MAG: carboxylating nicotinate-nucleotide diphosphorylase [Gammaproteobacteria bacterium]